MAQTTTLIDDRTEEQHSTHKLAVIGTDIYMSRWGSALDGISYTGWAFKDGDYAKCLAMVNTRSDIQRIRLITLDGYKPKALHTHIYMFKN